MTRRTAVTILARTPAPEEFESLPGYMLRLAVVNGQKSPARIYNRLRPLAFNRQRIGMRFSLEDLAALTGRSAAELNRLGQICSAAGASAIRTPHGPHVLDPADRRALFSPTHCPECVEDDSSIDASWSIEALRVCVRHHRFGLSKCDACGESIRWERSTLNECSCGREFVKAEPIRPTVSELGSADLLRASLMPSYQISDIAVKYGFPVQALTTLEFPFLFKALGLLGKFWARATKQGESKPDMLLRAGAVLRQWPYRFWVLLRRVHLDGGDAALTSCLFDRFDGLINREIRSIALNENPYRFLIDASVQYVVQAGLAPLIDKRIMSKVSDNYEPVYQAFDVASKQVGMDVRAIRSLAKRGAIPARPGVGTRLVVDPTDLIAIRDSWPTIGIRQASCQLGIPVRTFRCCVSEGIFELSGLRSERRGYSIADVQKFGLQLDKAAAQCNARLGQDSLSASYLMQSSLYSTPFKFSLVRDLVAGRLNALAYGPSFNQLRVHQSVCGLGSSASIGIRDNRISGTYAREMLMCSWSVLVKLIDEGLLHGEIGERAISVELRSLRRFAARWISDIEICNSIGWRPRPSTLSAILRNAGTPLRYGKVSFFARRRVPDTQGFAMLAYGQTCGHR